MDGEGVKQAFCLLMWRASGGAFDVAGHPILPPMDPNNEDAHIMGYCTTAFDCYNCVYMQQELSFHPQDRVTWVCPACVSRLKSRRDGRGLHLVLMGYYGEGYCQNPSCRRDQDDRYSIMLQLVLGDIQKEGG